MKRKTHWYETAMTLHGPSQNHMLRDPVATAERATPGFAKYCDQVFEDHNVKKH